MSTITALEAAMPAIAGATPYPWPYHGTFAPARTALVACVDTRWRVEGASSDEADARLALLAGGLGEAGALVVAVTATPARRPQGGAARPPQRGPDRGRGWLAADVEIGAGATSAFYASALDDVLRSGGRTDLVVAGWGLEGPVHSTVRAANDRGYECLLVADASIATDPRLAVASCEMVRHSGGIFGAFAQTGDVLDALGGTTRTRSGR